MLLHTRMASLVALGPLIIERGVLRGGNLLVHLTLHARFYVVVVLWTGSNARLPNLREVVLIAVTDGLLLISARANLALRPVLTWQSRIQFGPMRGNVETFCLAERKPGIFAVLERIMLRRVAG